MIPVFLIILFGISLSSLDTLDESLVHSSSLTYGTKLRLVQNSFELPFTECNVDNVPSSLSSLHTLQAGGNMSTRPSDIGISGPENITQSVKMDNETGFEHVRT